MSLVYPVVRPQVVFRACAGRFVIPDLEHIALLFSDRIEFCRIDDGHVRCDLTVSTPPADLTVDKDGGVLCGCFFTAGRLHDVLVLQQGTSLLFLTLNSIDKRLEQQGAWAVPKAKERDNLLYKPVSAASLSSLGSLTIEPAKTRLHVSMSLPTPRASPDGTHVFLASRARNNAIFLVLLSCYGEEILRLDTEYTDVHTLGWLSDDLVYFVYTNQRFHKKFQVCRLKNKLKQTFLKPGKKNYKPSLSFELNALLSSDFQSSEPFSGVLDLVSSDHCLLATRDKRFIRVNHKNGAWEPVLNVSNVVGAANLGDRAVVIAKPKDTRFYTVSSGTVRAISTNSDVAACLTSLHGVVHNSCLKLLGLSNGLVLDFKRSPFRVYELKNNTLQIADVYGPPPAHLHTQPQDFLVRTRQAVYTRDPNGDDESVRKIIDRENQLDIVFDRRGLFTFAKRDYKSVFAVFNGDECEIKLLEESHRTGNLKTRSSIKFEELEVIDFTVLTLNLVVVTLQTNQIAKMYLVNFTMSCKKHHTEKPVKTLLLNHHLPNQIQPPTAIVTDKKNSKQFIIAVYNQYTKGFTEACKLTVDEDGNHTFEKTRVDPPPPYILTENNGLVVISDLCAPQKGVCLAGSLDVNVPSVENVLYVEAPNVTDGSVLAVPGKDNHIWLFDSDFAEFRVLSMTDAPHHLVNTLRYNEPKLAKVYQLDPNFKATVFTEIYRSSTIRALPELPALVTPGLGSGVDAEAYLKSPDGGVYAFFRVQNRRLMESLQRLEKTVFDQRISEWLPPILKPDMDAVPGFSFAAFWDLDESEQKSICEQCYVDLELMRRVRPP